MKIEVKGLDRLLYGFERLGRSDEAEKTVNQTLAQCAEGVRARAVEILEEKVYSTPTPEGYTRTGQLKSAKNLTVEKISNGHKVCTHLNYSVYIEFGTGTLGDPSVPHTTLRFWKSKKKGEGRWYTYHGMKPRPFLQPAFNEYKAKLPEIVKKKLARSLTEAMRNG